MEALNGSLTISNSSNGKVYLSFVDVNSNIKFLEVELSMEDFAKGVFGLAHRPCKYITKGLSELGKQYIQEDYTFEIMGLGNKEEARRIIKNLSEQDPEWLYSTYLGSQDSFFFKDGKYFCKITRFKYV